MSLPVSSMSQLAPNGKDMILSRQPIILPKQLESVVSAENFVRERHRWNTNEEVASVLIAFDRHEEWLTREMLLRPPSGTMLLYDRKVVRYRKDGYCWKKRKDGKTTREDHMKLKVQGSECIYGCYVHSSILPTFHRRCYWLLQNPDIVLVHYLNVPLTRNNHLYCLPPSTDEFQHWKTEDLELQIRPMFASLKHFSGDLTETSVWYLVNMLINQKAHVLVETPVPYSPQGELVEERVIDSVTSNPQLPPGFHSPMGDRGVGGVSAPSDADEGSCGLSSLDEFFPLRDFPTCFDDLEASDIHAAIKMEDRSCCYGNGVGGAESSQQESGQSNFMDDLEDILGIVNTGLRGDGSPAGLLGPSEPTVDDKIQMDLGPPGVDFSPEWCYAEGGEKMLIAGKFAPSSECVVLFGNVGVHGQVVREGVIRCTIPAHRPGSIELKVVPDGSEIVSCGTFRYKSPQKSHFHVKDAELVQVLMGRIHLVRERLHLKHDVAVMDCLSDVVRCSFPLSAPLNENFDLLDLSLLHLASAIGSSEMISLLMMARNDANISEIIKNESDPLSEDSEGNIPITWACARGNFEAFTMLFQACPWSMTSTNSHGRSPAHFVQQIGKSFFGITRSLSPLPHAENDGADKGTQTTSIQEVHKAVPWRSIPDSKWPTDNDLCLPYRRSLQGQAPTIFGASRAKEYFREQCRKEELSIRGRASLDLFAVGPAKFHNRSESLNEELLEFQLEQNFRGAVSEPLLLDDQASLPESGSRMRDSVSNLTDFSTITDVDMEIATDDFMNSEHMMNLANQIIAAIPERNKPCQQSSLDDPEGEDMTYRSVPQFDPPLSLGSQFFAGAEDSGIGTPMEGITSLQEYRILRRSLTPSSTLSPTPAGVTSPRCNGSPDAAADFSEYFNAPATYVEEDFSLLTLSDDEQRRLYKAARIIQGFYRRHKDERSSRRQREVEAAVLIQSCYRRYKQFLYYKKMNRAAVLIQSRFRSYYAQKRYRRSREAATIIQNGYRAYKEKYKRGKNAVQSAVQQRLRNHYQATSMVKSPVSTHKLMDASDRYSQKDQATSDSSKSLGVPRGDSDQASS